MDLDPRKLPAVDLTSSQPSKLSKPFLRRVWPWAIVGIALALFVLLAASRIAKNTLPPTGQYIEAELGQYREGVEGYMSFEAKDSDIREVLVNFAAAQNLTLSLSDDVKGLVTYSTRNEHSRKVLDELCRQANCTWQVVDKKTLIVRHK